MRVDMKAIETTYKGALFRSRLEARWAAMFDLLNWSWVYEPFDGDYYIPDFLIEGKNPFIVEVRPCVSEKEYEAQTSTIKVYRETFNGDILILGASPTPYLEDHWRRSSPCAGLLWQDTLIEWGKEPTHWRGCVYPSSPWIGNHSEGSWHTASWFRCLDCSSISLVHELQSFDGYPCGCYDGDHHLGSIPASLLKEYWNKAGTQVRWKA